jgi:hypothetical protein
MRQIRMLLVGAALTLFLTRTASAQITVRMVADNFFAGYTGTATSATTQHFSGAWPTPFTGASFNPAGPYLYVAAWDDGKSLQGLLGDVKRGSGVAPTGSPLWEVCATNQPLTSSAGAAPSPAALTTQIVACNSGNRWHAPSAGPNNVNAGSNQVPSGMNLWGNVAAIEPTANWIWNTDGTTACAGANGFLQGSCNPGEYLIFRINLDQVADCVPPVPDFAIDWNAGFGTLVANGTNSQNELNYFWSIQESDASWNRFGPEIAQWFPGQAASFDLKTFFENGAKTKLKCDGYYRVKLAVSNRCINWRDTSKLVKIKCCPGEVTPQK